MQVHQHNRGCWLLWLQLWLQLNPPAVTHARHLVAVAQHGTPQQQGCRKISWSAEMWPEGDWCGTVLMQDSGGPDVMCA